MLSYLKTWLALKTDRRAVTALEYGLIAAAVAVVIVGSVATLGQNLKTTFTSIAASVLAP